MNQGYYRYPSIAGDRIVYVCEDDLWSASAHGGDAIRLTVSFGTCSFPASLARRRMDCVRLDRRGKPGALRDAGARRRTAPSDFSRSDDGLDDRMERTTEPRSIFVANPTTWYEGETRPFIDRARRRRAARARPRARARALVRPDGRLAIGRNAADPARWKRYRGGTSGEIWVKRRTRTSSRGCRLPDGNPCWPMWIGDRIYFLADHEGIGNIYSCALDGSDIRRHTNESEYYARFPVTDGQRIVYCRRRRDQAVTMSRADSVRRDRDRDALHRRRRLARRFENASESLEQFAPNPDGTQLAFDSRGQTFTMPLFEGAAIRHGAGSKARTRLTRWLHDGERLASVTDINGYEQIALVPGRRVERAAPGHQRRHRPRHRHGLLARRRRRRLCEPSPRAVRRATSTTARFASLDTCPSHRIEDLAFSPDGRYLAYVWSPAHGTSIIRVVKVRSGKIHDVTSPLRTDQSPAWDPDGKYLYFISTRDFNPGLRCAAVRLELSAGQPAVRRDAA